jgi:branched-chain amino acid transport system ATP-binding protein
VLARLKAEGLTMLLVEQNARAAFRVADRGYVLAPGGLIEEADTDQRRTGASTRRAYGLELVREESQR